MLNLGMYDGHYLCLAIGPAIMNLSLFSDLEGQNLKHPVVKEGNSSLRGLEDEV